MDIGENHKCFVLFIIRKIILSIFLILISIQLEGQDFSIKIDTTGKTCYPYSVNFNKEADTASFHLIFENYFDKDTIAVYLNDSCLIEKIITTDESLGKAESFVIVDNKSNSFIHVKINKSPLIKLALIKERKYILIRYLEMYKRMTICYLIFPPFYE